MDRNRCLKMLVSAGFIPSVRAILTAGEQNNKTVDEIAEGLREILDAYDKALQTGRVPL